VILEQTATQFVTGIVVGGLVHALPSSARLPGV
jgi:hypothetical protein